MSNLISNLLFPDPPRPSTTSSRLIDMAHWRLVVGNTSQNCMTLSYVWGKTHRMITMSKDLDRPMNTGALESGKRGW